MLGHWHFICRGNKNISKGGTIVSSQNPEDKRKQEQWKKPGEQTEKDPNRQQKQQQPQQPKGQQPGQKPAQQPSEQKREDEKDPNKRKSA
jgi:hypothetical protein